MSESQWGGEWGRSACWQVVNELPSLLKKMLGKQTQLPRIIATDRGPGFYQASPGTIVAAYKEALSQNKFIAFAGDEAKWQPPDLPDVLLHETAVAWVRGFFKRRPFKVKKKVKHNLIPFAKMLRQCELHINKNYDVAGLCKAFPRRIQALIKAKGDRLRH